jgi:hypothetical protein
MKPLRGSAKNTQATKKQRTTRETVSLAVDFRLSFVLFMSFVDKLSCLLSNADPMQLPWRLSI